jgi:small-conductance mechanosensitive channel
MLSERLSESWILSFAVIAITFLAGTTLRNRLGKFHQNRLGHTLSELAPHLSNVIYIIGIKAFIDVAPLNQQTEKWLDHTVFILSTFILLRLIQKTALISLDWTTSRTKSSETLELGFMPLIRNIVTLFLFLSGGIILLKHFNYDVMSLITALGVSSLAVGLAAKDTLSHMISGFILVIDRNLKPGDRVNLTGSIGDLEQIGLRSTRIRLSDGTTLIVPNSDLVNSKIVNLSIPARSIACSVFIRIPYSVLFEKVSTLVLTALDQMEKVSKDKRCSVQLISLADGHQLIQINFWVTDLSDAGLATSQLNELLLTRFQENDIPLLGPSFPHK